MAVSSSPVALIIQTRITDEGVGPYVAWQAKVGQVLQEWSGFLGQQVIAPSPPAQVDWIVVQRFRSIEEARAWSQSEVLHDLVAEVKPFFVGEDHIYLRTEAKASTTVSAIVSCYVPPEKEADFLQWEQKIFQVEAKAPGFIGHRLERPVAGIQENWVIALTFDSDENLNRWLNSPERAALLKEAEACQQDVQVRIDSTGFDFWAPNPQGPPPNRLTTFKGNMLALLVLYPSVYVWGYLISHPFIDSKGAPPWLSLFFGNIFTTQFLGWYAVGKAFHLFRAWLAPDASPQTNLKGWVILAALYALEMAAFAYVLTLPPLTF